MGQVAQRFSGTRQPTRGEPDADGTSAARRLTSNIKNAYSTEKLIEVLDGAVDGPIFNFFHASAAYTQLVRLQQTRDLQQRDWDSPVLLRLHARVEDMVLREQLDAQASANVLWSMAQLFDRFNIPTQLLAVLGKSLPSKARGMKAQELSNCLWACVKLKDDAPDVLEALPAIVAQIPNRAKDMIPQHLSNRLRASAQLKNEVPRVPALVSQRGRAKDMKPQELSNCLWASAQLKDVAPVVLEAVPAIAAQIPFKAIGMKPQELSICMWASAQLKDVAPDVLKAAPAIAAQIPARAEDMIPQQLSNSLWASAQLKDVAPDVLEAVPAIVVQIPDKAFDMIPQHLSNCLWAAARLKDTTPKVLEILPAITGEILLKINDMDPQGLANSLEALVLLRDSVPGVNRFLAAGGKIDDILRSAAARLNILLPNLGRKDFGLTVPVVIWACAKAEVYDGELLGSVARRLGSGTELSSLPHFNLCALSWSYQVLDTEDDFENFKTLLGSVSTKRLFSEADVRSCQFGRSGWNRAYVPDTCGKSRSLRFQPSWLKCVVCVLAGPVLVALLFALEIMHWLESFSKREWRGALYLFEIVNACSLPALSTSF